MRASLFLVLWDFIEQSLPCSSQVIFSLLFFSDSFILLKLSDFLSAFHKEAPLVHSIKNIVFINHYCLAFQQSTNQFPPRQASSIKHQHEADMQGIGQDHPRCYHHQSGVSKMGIFKIQRYRMFKTQYYTPSALVHPVQNWYSTLSLSVNQKLFFSSLERMVLA